MNYIYDILINLNKTYYDTYDWNINDDIAHIRKIPIYRISTDNLLKIKKYNITINNNFLTTIFRKTEIFHRKKVNCIDFCCLFSNGFTTIAFRFDKNGNCTSKSSLLFEEELETLEVANTLEEIKLDFVKNRISPHDKFKTRMENNIKKSLLKELGTLKSHQENDKLKYLYFECFNKKEDNVDDIVNIISSELNNHWENIYKIVYDFFKLTTIIK